MNITSTTVASTIDGLAASGPFFTGNLRFRGLPRTDDSIVRGRDDPVADMCPLRLTDPARAPLAGDQQADYPDD
jgi:hypothetical protein